jgi:hypothetical protein
MKEKRHDIDDLFKERLYDIETEVQPASWEIISRKVQTNTVYTVKKWIYGIAITGTIVVVAVTVLLLMQTNTEKETSASNIKEEQLNASTNNQTVEYSVKDVEKSETQPIEYSHSVPQSEKEISNRIISEDDRKRVLLPDGSTALLNRNSSISYAADFMHDKKVYVVGEVYFDIPASAGKKLIVLSNLSQIEAQGSSFIINSDKEHGNDEITVSSGKVECKSLLENNNRIAIFAGNSAVIKKGSDFKQNTIQDINYNDWVTQRIVFNNTKLDSVFETLEKYYNVTLTAHNSEILNCHFTGTFDRNNIDEILQVLSVSFNLSFDQKSKEFILSGNGCK